MNDQTRTDQAPWTDQVRADRSQWHRWYAWHPVICDAPGDVTWGLTIWRRHKRGQWEYQMEPGSEDDHRVGRLGRARYDIPVPREIDNPPTVTATDASHI